MDGTGKSVLESGKSQPVDALKDVVKAKLGGASNQDVRDEMKKKLLNIWRTA
ncbi:hypothetical protein EBL_c11940 [Shimwellia blattae DSM 4481 = NBRC 105725]|uniref:Uncharacterized protein n=2 Tax=Shimwellia blattae TaxID=563 RepID=I2B6Z4_SHIBC|nr:hypothetical protein EBL_c11940 [Shimwellia blattae DSM 4481 = NBRC 105725]GAB83007.1 hypothetical protein EB105725_40_00080 [Shimwellia blattae DSM 4481 = NBRC 105725]VDY63764.1 Uncharacterised protein [Shimwellia blattae]